MSDELMLQLSLLVLLFVVVPLVFGVQYKWGSKVSTPARERKRSTAPAARPTGPACPLCDRSLPGDMHGNRNHFALHLSQIEQGVGAGNYTWTCKCGPAEMHWGSPTAASMGLLVHMDRRHGVRMP